MRRFWQRKGAMTGGLYFGPAGWRPERWEVLAPDGAPDGAPAAAPETVGELLELLISAHIHRTSNLLPSLRAQLESFGTRMARVLVLNMLPSQPESALPYAMSHFAMAEVVAGFNAIRQCVPHKAAVVALDVHDRSTLRRWRAVVRQHRNRIQIRALLNTYPQGHPTILLHTLLRSRLREDELPTQSGTLLVDAVTCWAIGRFLECSRPMRERPVQVFVTDKEPRMVLARIGVTVAQLLESMNETHDRRQCILNGMLRGRDVDPGIAKIESATLAISLRPWPEAETVNDCINCGWCVDHCPTALNPAKLFYLAGPRSEPKSPDADVHEALNCINCGLCSYVCPSRLPLTEHIVALRGLCREEFQRRQTDVETHG